MSKLINGFDRLLNFTLILVNSIVVLLILIVSADVISTYFFNYPLKWSLEISEYLLAVMAFLGAAWLLRDDGHIRFDMLIERLSPKPRAIAEMIVSFIGFLVSFIITWFGTKVAIDLLSRGILMESILHVPRGVLVAFVPLGLGIMMLQMLRRFFHNLQELKTIIRLADKK